MIRIAFAGFALAVAILAVVLVGELRGGDGYGKSANLVRMAAPLPEPAAPDDGVADHDAALVARILARPLFDPDRRPEAVAAGSAAADGLPRLAGVLVGPTDRQAMFAPAQGGHLIIVQEGGRIGGFSVQSIRPGQVTLRGSAGTRLLHPAFTTASASAVSPLAGLPGFGGFRGPLLSPGQMPDRPDHANLALPAISPAPTMPGAGAPPLLDAAPAPGAMP